MHRLIDLTQTLDPDNRAKLPPQLASAAPVVAPAIDYYHPAKKGAEEFCRYLGCQHDDLPDGEGWGEARTATVETCSNAVPIFERRNLMKSGMGMQ